MRKYLSKKYCLKIVIFYLGLMSHVTVNNLFQTMYNSKYIYSMGYSTNMSLNNLSKSNDKQQQQEIEEKKLLNKKERLRIIAKDYGITITIFHIGISLVSLGACYAAVIRFVFAIFFFFDVLIKS